MFDTAIAGSLPKPDWLAETGKLWPRWQGEGAALQQHKLDATLLWIKAQEDAGLDVIGDGEMSRQHFVHGFLEQVEGIDFEHKVEMGIRADRYKAMVPQVVSTLRLKGRVHATIGVPIRWAGVRGARDVTVLQREPAQQRTVARVTAIWWLRWLADDKYAQMAMHGPMGLGPGERWRFD